MVLDKERIKLGKLRFGLDREEKELQEAVESGMLTVDSTSEPSQLEMSSTAVWLGDEDELSAGSDQPEEGEWNL